jgi:hypothetical protein
MLLNMQEEIMRDTQQPERQGKPLLDYFYRLMTVNPFLNWTSEERRENALEEISYRAEKVQKMNDDLDEIVDSIREENFHVQIAPGAETCQCCDIRYLCRQDRVIEI